MNDEADWKEINPAKEFHTDDQEAQDTPTKEIPKDLADSYKAIQLLVNVHGLLLDGRHEYSKLKVLDQSLKFIESIHKNALENALKHPQADLIPELKELIKKDV